MPKPTAALAAHRFGLGEPDLGVVGSAPLDWLRGQLGPGDAQRAIGEAGDEDTLPDVATGLRLQFAARGQNAEGEQVLRQAIRADHRARLATAMATTRPFAERLAMFWTNHFTVSLGKGAVRGLVGAFEREAIRPHIAGRFVDLLRASTTHPAMLRYLDNHLSAGPDSRIVQRLARRRQAAEDSDDGAASARLPRLTGLNENLAREVLELHTLGAAHAAGAHGPWGGYTQADVTALAAVLTGWRGPAPEGPLFQPDWHQPGRKTVLGRSLEAGPQGLDEALSTLARHPSTVRFIATKLARHFVADDPPTALVNRLAQAFTETDGDLPRVYEALFSAPEAWLPVPAKLKTPEEFLLSTARVLRLDARVLRRTPDGGLTALGQRLHAAPSPAGWPDRAEDWLGPEALWQRVEWSGRIAERLGPQVDSRALARSSLGPLLTAGTRQQLERAADPTQALALFLMAPEFQRR
jgi:uncharacterized protein (DUF1800 family)